MQDEQQQRDTSRLRTSLIQRSDAEIKVRGCRRDLTHTHKKKSNILNVKKEKLTLKLKLFCGGLTRRFVAPVWPEQEMFPSQLKGHLF